MSDTPLAAAEPVIRPPRRWRVSLVWLVPLAAALVGLSLVVQALLDKGPTISVSFVTAQGIEAGKTKVKFKDVDIGEVRAVHLAKDRKRVVVTIDLVKEAKSFAVADSRFWVVRPRLAGTGVSGLETVLSGSYIGVDGGHSDQTSTDFVGLETPPAVGSDVPGRRFVLTASDIGSLDVGSPVYFRRIPVGHVENFSLDSDGRNLTLGVFVKAPYDHFVTTDARFWHASGIDLRLDASGVKLDTQSLASILLGGVAFETPVEKTSARPAEEGAHFTLAASHAAALADPDGSAFPVLLRFHQSVRGLTAGAPVDFRGVEIGHVRWIGLTYDKAAGDFTALVVIEVFPTRLTPDQKQTTHLGPDFRARMLADLVKRGLRAQLRPGSLLTGQLYVAVDFFSDATSVPFDPTLEPLELPTVPSEMQELVQQVQAILRKVDKLPLDTLGQDAHRVLTDLDGTLRHVDKAVSSTNGEVLPELKNSLTQLQRTMGVLQATMAADSPLQQDARQALKGLADTARSLKALTDGLERQPESLLRGKKERDQ